MKGLILKDIYTFGKSMRGCIGAIAVFLLLPFVGEKWSFMPLFSCMMVGAIVQTWVSMDERSRWQSYVTTMPTKKSDYVSAKYLMALIATGVVMAASAITTAICMLSRGTFLWSNLTMMLALQFSISCLAVSIQLPWIFKYGVEKTRIAYYVMVLAVSCAVPLNELQIMTEGTALSALCLVAAGIYALAWWLSIRFYEKREV